MLFISVEDMKAALADHNSDSDDFLRRQRFADRTGHFDSDPELDSQLGYRDFDDFGDPLAYEPALAALENCAA